MNSGNAGLRNGIASSPLQSSLMSKTYLKSDHFNGGIMAKCELDKVGREISPCMASVPRSAIGRRAREGCRRDLCWNWVT
jgi:hypothetical protein